MGKPSYVGIFLDRASRELLLARVPARHPIIHADHLTLAFGLALSDLKYAYPIGIRVKIHVRGEVEDKKGQAVVCSATGLPGLASNQSPHITVSCNHGTPPSYSNTLLQGYMTSLNFEVTGVIDYFPRTLPVESEIPQPQTQKAPMPQKLNQILAIEKSTKNRNETEFTKIYQSIGKAELVTGFQKNYTPKEEGGQMYPSETKKVQFKAEDQIKKVKKEMSELLDLSAIKDKTNCIAKADIVVDDQVLAKDVPATHLLYLEHKLADLVTFTKKIPALDQSDNWKPDSALGLWATEPFENLRTKKIEEFQVIVPATPQHPAQVQKIVKDVPEGTWKTVKYSGAMPQDQIDAISERLEKLQKAVKSARAEANTTAVDSSLKPGAAILGYIFG